MLNPTQVPARSPADPGPAQPAAENISAIVDLSEDDSRRAARKIQRAGEERRSRKKRNEKAYPRNRSRRLPQQATRQAASAKPGVFGT